MKFVVFATVFSTLLSKLNADSICGPQGRFMVAVKCGDGSNTLHCAPNNLKDRSQFCSNPNDKWTKAKCNNKGGVSSVDISNSGCFANSFNPSCEMPVPSFSIPNLGFESGDLTGWTTTGPTPASVVCDGSSPEGNCYAQLTTDGTYAGTDFNVLTRSDLVVPNFGGCNNYVHVLTFWYRFANGDWGGYFNDQLTVSAKDASNNVLFTQTLDSNGGSTSWLYASINLGSPPVGSSIQVTFSASTTNGGDGILPSYSYIDGLQIYKV